MMIGRGGAEGRVLGVDLGGTKCHGVVADGDGVILDEVLLPTGSDREVPQRLVECLRELRRRAGGVVRAAAIGVPALIDTATGLAEVGPNVSWHGYDVAALVGSEVLEPFQIDNDVNLAAIGEGYAGHGRGAGSFVTLSLGTGIGAALVVGGTLVRGYHNAAGEVGYLSVSRDRHRRGARPTPALEELISGRGLQREAADLLEVATPEDVLAAAAAAADADADAVRVVDVFLERVASLIADIGALFDPQLVVLDGGLGRGLERWRADLHARVHARIPYPPEIAISQLAPTAAVVGAVACALALLDEQASRACVAGVQAR